MDLGRQFAIEKTFVKPFAACGANQVPMQVASQLAHFGLHAKDIVKIVERLRPRAMDYPGLDHAGPFRSPVQAMMSLQFCAAATILSLPVDAPNFLAEHYANPEVAETAAKVRLVPEPGRLGPRFEVHTRDGRVLVAEEQNPDRSIHVPTLAGMQEKFRRSACGCLGVQKVAKVIDAVSRLENVANIKELTCLLRG